MKNYNMDILSLEDLLETLIDKGYDYDDLHEMFDHALDEIYDGEDELEEDDDEDWS